MKGEGWYISLMNPEGNETQPAKPFESALSEYQDLVGGLNRGDLEYNGEQTRDALSTKLLNVQMAGRLNKDDVSKLNTTLDHELAKLAEFASMAANKHGDDETATFFSKVAESFKTEIPSSKTSPVTQQPPSSPRPKERITISGPAHVIIRERKGRS